MCLAGDGIVMAVCFGGGGEMGTGGLEGGSFAGDGDGADGVGRFVMGRVICLVWFKS